MHNPKSAQIPTTKSPKPYNIDSIDTFLFDLGNVLIYFSHDRMFAQVGTLTGRTSAAVKSWFTDQGLLVQLETGKLTTAQFATEIRNRSALEFTEDQLSVAMSDIFTPNEDMVALLPEITKCGKKLVIVSNTSAVHFDCELRKHNWMTLFDDRVLSFEVGAMKPDPAFYSAAIVAAGSPPERCLFVDDLAVNIDAARVAGFQTLHFTGTEVFMRAFSFGGEGGLGRGSEVHGAVVI